MLGSLQQSLDCREESSCFSAVNDAVITREAHGQDDAGIEGTVLSEDLLAGPANTKNANLWVVDNGCCEHAATITNARNSKRATTEVFEINGSISAPPSEFTEPIRKLDKSKIIGILQDRNHESVFSVNGAAKIDNASNLYFIDEVINRAVHGRVLTKGFAHGGQHEWQGADSSAKQ